MVRASLIRKLESIEDPKLRDVLISFLEEAERIIGETVTRHEFLEFVEKTNENFERVWKAIGELTKAQQKTEERLNELTQRVNSLAEAQQKTEERLNELTQRDNSLAEAQQKTEKRLNELVKAQKRTEERLNELAEAQKRTEEKLEKLIGEHRKTREQVGGLANAFGYTLEDRAIKGLPSILKDRFNITITQPLRRDHIEVGRNKFVEVNLIGKGRSNGKELTILGECKVQLRKRDIDKFLNRIKMLEKSLPGEKFLIFVTYQTTPQVKKFVDENKINLIYSYELPL